MIDLHCHILPGIDDGSISMDMSLAMVDQAIRSGVHVICATPHTNAIGYYLNYESPQLEQLYQQLAFEIRRENMPLELVRGAEVFATRDVMEQLSAGKICSMNRTSYYLVEFDFGEGPRFMMKTIRAFRSKGYIPIIAHPERYDCVQETPHLVSDWLQEGALLQVNKGSILGHFGREVERTADFLLDQAYATCIGTDAHGLRERNTDMKEVARYIGRAYGQSAVEILTERNPDLILRNKRIN